MNQTVTLAPGEHQIVDFHLSELAAGSYKIKCNSHTVTLVVTAPKPGCLRKLWQLLRFLTQKRNMVT